MDIVDFFVKNMVNENLGVICNAQVVHADMSEYGAMDEKCLHLAELAATAVDFPKTGKYVTMPPDLKPKIYPDFMGKENIRSYKSQKILGRLYRKIKDAAGNDCVDAEAEALPYDAELEVEGASEHVAEARQSKWSYDAQLNALLGQYRVGSEAEVVTGHVWSLPKHNSRKQGQLKERLKNAYHSLRKEFRRVFEDEEADDDEEEKGVIYERKASAWYQVTYHPRWVRREAEGEEIVPLRLSFAWIAADYLVRIKVRRRGEKTGTKPIDSLANYLSERI